MTVIIASYPIQNNEICAERQIDLIEGLSPAHLDFTDSVWKPELADAKNRALFAFGGLPTQKQTDAAWQEKLGAFGAPDEHWEWSELHASMLPEHSMYALVDAKSVEAVMRIDVSKHSRAKAAPSAPIVYVDYLATAPWNRHQIQSPPRYRGFGKVLLGFAVNLSLAKGFDGRCGLHALPQAEGFYVKAGMSDFGPDTAYENLRYFEFSPSAARAFLNH